MAESEAREERDALYYMVKWPMAAPGDSYKAGEKYHWLVAALAWLVPGLPRAVGRLLVGPVMATVNYYLARKRASA